MRIEIMLNNKESDALEYITKSLNVDRETVLKYGLEILQDILLVLGNDELKQRFTNGNVNIISNIFSLGKELYKEYLYKILDETGIPDNSSVEDMVIEDGCVSSIALAPIEEIKATGIYLWNHEYPLNIVLNYYLEKDEKGIKWVEKLIKIKDKLEEKLMEEFELENVRIDIDDIEDAYNISVVTALGENNISLRKMEDIIENKIGKIPK